MEEKSRLDQQVDNLQQQLELQQAFFTTFTSPHGQVVLKHLCEKFHAFEPTKFKSTEEALIEKGARELILSIVNETYKDITDKMNVLKSLKQ